MARHKTVETDATPGNPEGHVAEGAHQKAQKAQAERKPRSSMQKNGWGPVFTQAATEGRDRQWVIEEMKARYPDKVETILKWTDWYKNFYNMGKIQGFENPVKVSWKSEVDANREQKKADRAATREAARQERQAAKELAKAEKKAAREAAKAEKVS